jgi:hypothetical protein
VFVLAAALLATTSAWSGTATQAATQAQKTKLLGGPLLFRVTGYKGHPRYSLRYVVVFKLNRDPQAMLSGKPPYAYGRTTFGAFHLEDVPTPVTSGVYRQYPPRNKPRCLYGQVLRKPAYLKELARYRIGDRLTVTLQPLTVTSNGKSVYGPKLVSHPVLRTTTRELKDAPTVRLLRSIGCTQGPYGPGTGENRPAG